MDVSNEIERYVEGLLRGSSVSGVSGDEWDRARAGLRAIADQVTCEGTFKASRALAAGALAEREARSLDPLLSSFDPRIYAVALVLSWAGLTSVNSWLLGKVVEAVKKHADD